MDKNIVWQRGLVSHAQRQAALGQRGAVLWLTGLLAKKNSVE